MAVQWGREQLSRTVAHVGAVVGAAKRAAVGAVRNWTAASMLRTCEARETRPGGWPGQRPGASSCRLHGTLTCDSRSKPRCRPDNSRNRSSNRARTSSAVTDTIRASVEPNRKHLDALAVVAFPGANRARVRRECAVTDDGVRGEYEWLLDGGLAIGSACSLRVPPGLARYGCPRSAP